MSKSVILKLNLPPTVNHYWGQSGKRRFIGAQGREFRQHVVDAVEKNRPPVLYGRLLVHIVLIQTDKRRWDIDNRIKPLLDALEHANVFENDSQVDALQVDRLVKLDEDQSWCKVIVQEISEPNTDYLSMLRNAGAI